MDIKYFMKKVKASKKLKPEMRKIRGEISSQILEIESLINMIVSVHFARAKLGMEFQQIIMQNEYSTSAFRISILEKTGLGSPNLCAKLRDLSAIRNHILHAHQYFTTEKTLKAIHLFKFKKQELVSVKDDVKKFNEIYHYVYIELMTILENLLET